MPVKNGQTVTLEGVRLIFRNFSGEERRYNAKGNREFAVVLPDMDTYRAMEADGWNVKLRKESDEYVDEGDVPEETPYLSVKCGYGQGRPPQVVVITQRGRSNWGEEKVAMLDSAEIVDCDLIVSAYNWSSPTGSGVSAYLKSLYVTIVEDELALKYAELPEQ